MALSAASEITIIGCPTFKLYVSPNSDFTRAGIKVLEFEIYLADITRRVALGPRQLYILGR